MGLVDIFVATTFGWPAVITSILLMIVGIRKESWQTVLVGAVLTIPFTFYLSLTPRFEWIAPLAGIAYCSVPIFVHRGAKVLAVMLALPGVLGQLANCTHSIPACLPSTPKMHILYHALTRAMSCRSPFRRGGKGPPRKGYCAIDSIERIKKDCLPAASSSIHCRRI